MKCYKVPRKLKKALRRITREITHPKTSSEISEYPYKVIVVEVIHYKVKGSRTKIINRAISKLTAERERLYKRMNERMYERCNTCG